MTTFSANEIGSKALKAARGAGYSWGLAEEAGFAARWLSSRGLPWAEPLLDVLDTPMGNCVADLVRFESDSALPLSPIELGAVISDSIALGNAFTIEHVRRPILLLPFIHDTFCTDLPAWRLSCGSEGQVTVQKDRMSDPSGILDLKEAPVTVQRTGVPFTPWTGSQAHTIDPKTLARLDAYAMRTTVPATEASRAGAGAGRSDND